MHIVLGSCEGLGLDEIGRALKQRDNSVLVLCFIKSFEDLYFCFEKRVTAIKVWASGFQRSQVEVSVV